MPCFARYVRCTPALVGGAREFRREKHAPRNDIYFEWKKCAYAPGTDSVWATNTWFPSGSSRLNHFTPEPGPYKSSLTSFVLTPFSLSSLWAASMSAVEK